MNPVDLSKLRILIVDDEAGALNALADIFEDQHCRVTTAASGSEARAAFQSSEFDVALLDIRLPDCRGIDLLREIRNASDLTRCIMVTASPDAEDAIDALNEGASAYIQKPIEFEAMTQTILSVVDKYLKSVEERRLLHDLSIVRSVGEAAMDLDLEPMLGNVLARLVDGFHADSGAVFLMHEGELALHGVVQYKLSDRPIAEYVVIPGEGFVGRVVTGRRVMDVEDVGAARLHPHPFLNQAGVVSALAAPIVSPKGVLGVILLGWRKPRAFTVQDRDLIAVAGQRTGLATTNALLYAREDESKQRAEYLARVSQELNSQIEDVQKVVQRVTRLAAERLGDGCAIFLVQRGTNALQAAGSYHTVQAKQQIFDEFTQDSNVIIGEGVIGQVILSQRPFLAAGDALLAGTSQRTFIERLGVTTLLALPLTAHGDVLGALALAITESASVYQPETHALALEFAERAAVAIENAALLRDAQRKREELQSLFGLTRTVSSTLQEPEVMHSILRGTAQLLDVPACCIASYQVGREAVSTQHEIGMPPGHAAEMATVLLQAWPDLMLAADTPFRVRDLRKSGEHSISEAARRLGFVSMLSVALDVEGVRNHTLLVLTNKPDDSLLGKRQLLATLGGLAGVALTNARSYKREQTIAERVQQWILSTEFGEAPEHADGIEIATDYHAALVEASVGGDFYDLFPVGPQLMGVVIGDVSGKGLDAALQTQAVKHTLRAYALESRSPARVLNRTNEAMCQMLPADVFITLFYALLDTETHAVVWANAGHDAPLHRRADASIETLDSSGRALGLLAGATYGEFQTYLHPGDLLLLYTDGLSEARKDGEFLETSGVADLLRGHMNLSAHELVEHIYEEVREYTSDHIHDDIALLALKVDADFVERA